MKAIILPEAGEAEKLQLTEIPMPEIDLNEVRVKVKAMSINPVDVKTRSGKALYSQLKEQEPVILGWDISGEIASTGKSVAGLEVGDEVFGMVNFPGHGRAYAEFVVAPFHHLAKKPANITHEEAAVSTLAALTAWQVLKDQLKIQAGERVLIHAGAGGVGHFAIQIAKHLGAYVITTTSAANADFVKELGADEHIDYRATAFEEAVSSVDAVFDTVGGDISARSLACLKNGGRLVAIAGGITEEVKAQAAEKAIQALPYLVQSSGNDMKSLAELLEKGVIKPCVSHVFPFGEMAAAHQQIETGRTRGKVIVKLED
ncbi:NADP-dependent oxidoreductase [Pedobacter sp. SYSU D00535]|uniref:NADP-dependent oxidoreductase n=1 Tax=Pedobacter sp. SYSU D00535 TaxID=2810308 RepID=UPI001A975C81|nr:NADP-dependent oxidoreductase [Pedobacter sp. SYSU D00535]